MTSINRRRLMPLFSASFDLDVCVQYRSWRRAFVLLAVLSITACKTPDHETAVNKLGGGSGFSIEAIGESIRGWTGIGPYDSLDGYSVIFANGEVQSGIFITPDGKIASVWVRPSAAAMPAAR
jgi:hypothetical protein